MSPGLGLGAQAPKHNLSSPKWMSAHLVLRATQSMLMNNIRCSIQLDNEQRLAYPVRTLELVMAVPLSESASKILANDRHACRLLAA